MPCNTIQQSKVEFLATSTDPELLKAGLEAMGYTVERRQAGQLGDSLSFRDSRYRSGSYDVRTGELELDQAMDGNAIKRSYSEQVVESQARAFDWQIEWTTNEQGEREALVQRRS